MINTEVKDITSKEHAKLPERYISFTDDLESALQRLNGMDEKLLKRGLVIVRPLNAFRIQYFGGTKKEFFQLAFELKKKE